MATTITASSVVSDFGAYYINQGQNMTNIRDRLRAGFESMKAFTVIESEDTVLRYANVAYAEALQSFQTTFTPKGGVTYTSKAIPLYNVKTDQLFLPDTLKNSWLQFLISNSLDRTTFPFVAWFIEIYLMKQIMNDLELQAIYNGVYAAPTAGTANAANQTMNGVKKLINNAVTGGTIATIATGSPSTDPVTWCGQVEAFMASIPEVYWRTGLDINMSNQLALRYIRGRRIKYNTYYDQNPAGSKTKVEDFDNVQVVPQFSHTGADKIWATPKLNALLGFMGSGNMSTVQIEKVDRQVKLYTDFWIGVGFIDDGVVFTNDQDLS